MTNGDSGAIAPGFSSVNAPVGPQPHVAVLIPCCNEEAAIGKVVDGFRKALPAATIFVFDNNSTDDTARIAAGRGAIVRRENRQGKGNVVRRMFADVQADVYVMVDGDSTYDPLSARKMVALLLTEKLDMVVGSRVTANAAAYRRGHRIGNKLLTKAVAQLFDSPFLDILSGYRVFSRRFVKSFPAMSNGFETETELTIHALELRLPFAEVETPYSVRSGGSSSKLQTYADGAKILHGTRLIGNQAAHETLPPNHEMLVTAIQVAENLLPNVFILPKIATRLPKRKSSPPP